VVENNDPGRRNSYLINGRRVAVSDLLDAGLLSPGATLTFYRTRLGEQHRATVTSDGRIVLASGESFTTPSKAAAAAADVPAMDGWRSWTVDTTGGALDELRQQLLNNLPPQNRSTADTVQESPSPRDFLREAQERADSDVPVSLTVQNLLTRWGAATRSYEVDERISADLENRNLRTTPDFRHVPFETSVRVVAIPAPATDSSLGSDPEESGVVDEVDPIELGFTLGQMPSALGGLTHVPPQLTIEQATTLMLINDFSQLAVRTKKGTLLGAITWPSIARAQVANPSASIRDALVQAPSESYRRPLVEVLDRLQSEGFVFVHDDEHDVCGIVTTTDVVRRYDDLALPFLLFGELDRRLRRIISRFPFEEIRVLCDPYGKKGLQSIDKMTMGDYEQVLKNKEKWASLNWRVDRLMVTDRLSELRQFRNNVMHFNPDSTPLAIVPRLRYMLDLLRAREGAGT
jgi:CBS domain-containing protein